MRVVVRPTIRDHSCGAPACSPERAPHTLDHVQPRNALGDVVVLGRGRRPGQQEPACVGDQLVLELRSATLDRAGGELAAPRVPGTYLAFAILGILSLPPAGCRRSNNTRCSRSQTPAACQACSVGHAPIPEPSPSRSGSGAPGRRPCGTNTMPCSSRRSSWRVRPGPAEPPRPLRHARLEHLPKLIGQGHRWRSCCVGKRKRGSVTAWFSASARGLVSRSPMW